ncbi:hypothetical protein P7C73_g3582, partial [Tremellales sp. Uapishka_1]
MSSSAAEVAAEAALSGNKGMSFMTYLLSFWIDAILFGVMWSQLIQWSSHETTERKTIKAVVYWVAIASTALTAVTAAMNFNHFAYNFGDYAQFLKTSCALGFLIEYSINPPSFIGIFLEVIQSKIYVVGLLAVLNSRYHLHREMHLDAEWKKRQLRSEANQSSVNGTNEQLPLQPRDSTGKEGIDDELEQNAPKAGLSGVAHLV